MDIDIEDIRQRLDERLSAGDDLLFWEDEPGEYRESLTELGLGDGAQIVDTTGRELASKRKVLREAQGAKLVVYRAGGAPNPNDDFLYDVKLSAAPFTCSMEGLWADECGISPALAGMLAEHAKFFNSKDRRGRLLDIELPKGTPNEIRLAMLAACSKSKASAATDAVRDIVGRLLVEYARGNEATLRTIAECGLQGALWANVAKTMGYTAPSGEDPTIADLAFRMLQTHCSPLWFDVGGLLTNDAIRVIDSISKDSHTRKDFEDLAEANRSAIAAPLDPSEIPMESLLRVDTLPDFDEWILQGLLNRLEDGTLSAKEATAAIETRRHTLWFERYEAHYECISAATGLLQAITSFESQVVSKTTAKEIFNTYCLQWFEIDTFYRKMHTAKKKLPNGRFKKTFEASVTKACTVYDKYLVDLTDRWQLHLLDEGSYPPAVIPAQSSFFHERVQIAFPKAESGRRIGVIVSDALRYEVGAELASRINDGTLKNLKAKAAAKIDGMACMLPSYTQLGMAALLPAGAMEIDPATENVRKSGSATDGLANRQKLVAASIEGAVLLKAVDVLDGNAASIENAPLVMVYHNVIDKRGDNRETETEVFAACDQAIDEIDRIATELLRAGCGQVLVTADHGFLYQTQEIERFNYATVKGLHDLATSEHNLMNHTRRFAVGHALPESDMLIEYSAADLSLEGSYKVALPKGITRLRLSGSGARYVHGGASLQENAIPVVTITPKKRGAGVSRTGAQGFLCGRPVITGPTVSLDVYQTKPCSDKVAPLTVKVGLYGTSDPSKLLSASEQTIELASTADSSEERKTRVTLPVVNDVDDHPKAVLRISSRIGSTNQYRAEWEQELSVNRAFGNDFDF